MIGTVILIGWVLAGLMAARVAWLRDWEDVRTNRDHVTAMMVTGACILTAPVLVVAGALAALTLLVTMPTRADRRARRLAAMEDERERVRVEARRLGLPLVEDDAPEGWIGTDQVRNPRLPWRKPSGGGQDG